MTVSIVYLFFILFLWFCPYWPSDFWWAANVVQVAPMWITLIPLGLFFLAGLPLKNRNIFIVHLLTLTFILFGILGFKVTMPLGARKGEILMVASINLGEKANLPAVIDFLEKENPDVVAFQEASGPAQKFLREELPFQRWHLAFQENQGIASRHKIKNAQLKNRRVLGDWGGIAGKYELETAFGPVYLFNLHLESPRQGINALMHKRREGIWEMKRVTGLQEVEASTAAQWATSFEPVIVTGDFNMQEKNPIFRTYFSNLNNAFSRAGFGFGFSKYTRWHGVRIDHVLYDRNWQASRCYMGADIGGDHRPVIAALIFTGKPMVPVVKKKPEHPMQALLEGKKVLVFEDFETVPEKFGEDSSGFLSVDFNDAQRDSGALLVQINAVAEDLSAGIYIDNWSLERTPVVQFAYRIPEGTPLSMRVQTSFGDWICIGETENNPCPHTKTKQMYRLIDDGQWHEARINVRLAVQSVLTAMKFIKAFEFYMPQNRSLGDKFWLDDFVIYEP